MGVVGELGKRVQDFAGSAAVGGFLDGCARTFITIVLRIALFETESGSDSSGVRSDACAAYMRAEAVISSGGATMVGCDDGVG